MGRDRIFLSLSHAGKAARDAARQRGELYYTPTKACSRGHLSMRYVANQTCVECSKEQQRRAELVRRAKMLEDTSFRASRRKQKNATGSKWSKANRGIKNAQWSQWRANLIQRTPLWSDLKAIKQIYLDAARLTKTTGEVWHVDHTLPLNGKTVSGLHVPENLQILPAVENLLKGAKVLQ